MLKKRNSEKGVVTLEACIAVTLFIFLMLYMYSFFVVFETRGEMGHLILSTTNSLSLDTYSNENLGNSGNLSQVVYGLYDLVEGDNTDFVSLSQWHEDSTVEVEGESESSVSERQLSEHFEETIRKRFVAYLTDGGSEEDAEKALKKYHIIDGLDGLDFSGSFIDEKERLHITVRYKMEYEFQVFGFGEVEMEQSACSKLWK